MMKVNRTERLLPILSKHMNIPSFSNHARAAVLFLALSCAASLFAAPTEDAVQPTQPSAGIETVNLAELTTPDVMRLAYYILLPGNHNYNSHRAYAMTEISEAAHSFGLDLKEHGKGREDQKKSDGRLVLARRLLEPCGHRSLASGRLFSPQTNSIGSVSGMSRCSTLNENGLVNVFGSVTVIWISSVP